MSASPSTKLQVNFKLADGTLINIYADNIKELETSLMDVGMVSTLIKATSNDLGGGAPAPTAASIAAQFNAPAAQSSSVIEEGHCKHGKLVYRESKPGAPKSWKGWFCPSPQGTPDQCAPKFLR
jgi:hypothetical protein